MFFMLVCWPKEYKEMVKQQESFYDKYSLVIINVFVLVYDACFSIDARAFP